MGFRHCTPTDDKVRNIATALTGGVMLPIALLIYGIYCWTSGNAFIIGSADVSGGGLGFYHVSGTKAVAIGICCIGLAIALHSQFVWKRTSTLWRFGNVGLLIGMIIWLSAVCYFIWVMSMDGWH